MEVQEKKQARIMSRYIHRWHFSMALNSHIYRHTYVYIVYACVCIYLISAMEKNKAGRGLRE